MQINNVTAALNAQAIQHTQVLSQAILNRQILNRQAINRTQASSITPEKLASNNVRQAQAMPQKYTTQTQPWHPDERYSAAHIQYYLNPDLVNSAAGSLDLLHKQAQSAYESQIHYQSAGHTNHTVVDQLV